MSSNDIKQSKTTLDKHELYEECALCHRITEVKADTPVECRKHYIYGVGQLCEKCYHKTYCESGE